MKNTFLILLVTILGLAALTSAQNCGSGVSCSPGFCCSSSGYCGQTDLHCGAGCNPTFGQCGPGASSVVGSSSLPLSADTLSADTLSSAPSNSFESTSDSLISSGLSSSSGIPSSMSPSGSSLSNSFPTSSLSSTLSKLASISAPTKPAIITKANTTTTITSVAAASPVGVSMTGFVVLIMFAAVML